MLQEITRTGRVESSRQGAFVQRDYYEERPIALRLTGQYHELGRYAADIAHLSRIVTCTTFRSRSTRKSLAC